MKLRNMNGVMRRLPWGALGILVPLFFLLSGCSNLLESPFGAGDDAAQLSGAEGSSVRDASGGGENSLGVWLWYLDGTGYSTHQALAEDLAGLGVSRIYVKVADGANDPSEWPEVSDASVVQAYRGAGLEVWAWAYNYPGNDKTQADALYYAAKAGYEGFVTDIEKEFNGKTQALHTFFSEMVQARTDAVNAGYADADFPLYCTSWGNPEDHGMRVDIIDQYVDAHMPQTYVEVWGESYREQIPYWISYGTREYRDMGCTKPIHHIVSAEYDEITADQIDTFFAEAGAEASLWRIPGGESPLSIWDTLGAVDWQTYGDGENGSGDTGSGAKEFTDIQGSWAEDEISFLGKNAYVSGYDDGTYRPQGELTRAEFAAFLVSVLDPEEKTAYQDRDFSDISGHWAAPVILQAARAGFIAGYGDGTFRPQETLTNLQAVIALANGLGMSGDQAVNLADYLDDAGQIPGWAEGAMKNALAHHLLVGYPQKRLFQPNQSISRAAMAVLFYQVLVYQGAADPLNNPYIVQPGTAQPVSLTLECPERAVTGETVSFQGAAQGVNKVVVSVDGYVLYEEEITEGAYQFEYTFSGAGENRRLVANGFDRNGVLLKQEVRRMDIAEPDSGWGRDLAEYADTHWQELLDEANGRISGGTACAAFVSASLRRFGFSIDAVVTDGTASEDASGITLMHQLEQAGFQRSADASQLREGDICFTIDKWFDDDGGGGYYPTHTYIFMEWVTPGDTSYAWIVDNQGQRHQRNMTVSGSYDPFQYFMSRDTAPNYPGDDSDKGGYVQGVPYFYQYDNSTNPDGSCQNTAAAMVLNYYGAQVTPDEISANYGGTSRGQTVSGWEEIFNSEAEYWGLSVRDSGSRYGSVSQLREILEEGRPAAVHG